MEEEVQREEEAYVTFFKQYIEQNHLIKFSDIEKMYLDFFETEKKETFKEIKRVGE